ncbi:MAG: lichenicidin A2 family type 2 lantibiotic [Butyrivibrio sp.]|nr:lichenicidin A2 family type 2 lantibiotic [Butyrivibrio sp.]
MGKDKFIGDAFEELTIDEMKMVQGSGNADAESVCQMVASPTAAVQLPWMLSLIQK